ncbi:trypsin-like serine peptidase [Nocardia sp. NPDC020380]|uniref:trypsin-like serine peptidase n=1 Tax=Nocardia sp. NPDC020380 TaxID=3364309 RepID=UPI0037BBFBA9
MPDFRLCAAAALTVLPLAACAHHSTTATTPSTTEAPFPLHTATADTAATRSYWADNTDYWTPTGARDDDGDPAGGVPEDLRITPGADRFGLAPADPSTDPRAAVTGMLVFTKPDGSGPAHCTASVLDTENQRTIVSAAHCVTSGHDFNANMAFVPQARPYHGPGDHPYGIWPVEQIWISKDWFDPDADYSTDVAVMTVAPKETGERLQQVTGGVAVRPNTTESFRVSTYGYPGDAPYTGDVMLRCDGDAVSGSNPKILTTPNCDPPGGASGSPAFAAEGDGYAIVGVLSGGSNSANFARLSVTNFTPLLDAASKVG